MKAGRTKRVVDIVADITLWDASEISLSTHLYHDLEVDSLSALELLVALEDAFAIEIETDAAKRIQTVGSLVDLVSELVDAKPPREDV